MLTIEISGDTVRLTSNLHAQTQVQARQIENIDTTPQKNAPWPTPILKIGERATDTFGEGTGIYAGIMRGFDGQPDYHLFLVDGDIKLAWKNALAWGAKAGDSLPHRREQALLFANLPEHFEKAAYWSCEEDESNSGWAWGQHFVNGTQYDGPKDVELRARAVRRLFI